MVTKTALGTFGDRLAALGARLDERMRSRGARSGFVGSAYRDLHDLFTRDVTRDALRDMVQRDTRETFRFFVREVDFDSLRGLPWYKRYPHAGWRVFVAIAYRLSPPRRIAFAVALFTLLFGLLESLRLRPSAGAATGWWLVSVVILGSLLVMELRDKLDLKGDLEIAREIQFGLVPQGPYRHGYFEIHCHMEPANTVGGDYYDIIPLDDRRTAVVIGDVSGKGMPAALLMALLQGSLRTLIAAGLRGSELTSKLNDYLCDSIPSSRLVTLFYGELDTDTGELAYVNAGHNAPVLLRSDRSFERLASTAMVLGVAKGIAMEAGAARLDPGDRLLLFTDGITEAFDEREEEYGEARLLRFLLSRSPAAPEGLIDALIRDVRAFAGGVRQTDDMTVVALVRAEGGAA